MGARIHEHLLLMRQDRCFEVVALPDVAPIERAHPDLNRILRNALGIGKYGRQDIAGKSQREKQPSERMVGTG